MRAVECKLLERNLHVEGAFITIEPGTGYIQTMVGGSKFTPKNQFNRAMQARRQTGSSFKPFVYGAAINNFTPFSSKHLFMNRTQSDFALSF